MEKYQATVDDVVRMDRRRGVARLDDDMPVTVRVEMRMDFEAYEAFKRMFVAQAEPLEPPQLPQGPKRLPR